MRVSERVTVYFDRPGGENTEEVLRLAKRRAEELQAREGAKIRKVIKDLRLEHHPEVVVEKFGNYITA